MRIVPAAGAGPVQGGGGACGPQKDRGPNYQVGFLGHRDRYCGHDTAAASGQVGETSEGDPEVEYSEVWN